MPYVTLSNDQKAQLIGWLNREKDFLLSIKAMAERIQLPECTGTLELIKRDLEFVIKLRSAVRGPDEPCELSENDIETVIDVARANTYENRASFWKSIVDSLEQVSRDPNPS